MSLGIAMVGGGRGRRWSRSFGAAGWFVPVLLLAWISLCGSAFAFRTHVFSSSFGSFGSAAGEVSGPVGVAVSSSSHAVYVGDAGNHRVDEFSAPGEFIRAWGWGVADGLPAFEVCSLVCQPGLSGSGPGEFVTPAFVAVDNSGGASAGDVYVGDTGTNLVQKFDATGSLVESWGNGGQLDGSSATSPPGAFAGPFGPLAGITVDAAGNLEVLDTNTRLFKFAEDGTLITDFDTVRGTSAFGLAANSAGDFFKVNGNPTVEEVDGAGNEIGQVTKVDADELGHTTGLAVDLSENDLYVDHSGDRIDHYSASCVPDPTDLSGCDPVDSFATGTLSGAAGVAVDSSNHTVFVADTANNRIAVFTGPVTLPDVTTGEAAEAKASSVKLTGTVDPEGIGLADCHFDYGLTSAYGQVAACVPSVEEIPADFNEHAVSAEVTGLEPDTTYHFRLQASNANGTNYGQDATVSTLPPPSIDGASASNLTESEGRVEVDLNVRIDPNGSDTTFHLEYGTSSGSYDHVVPVPDQDIGSGSTDVSRTVHVAGLETNKTYHWRVVATNESGTTTSRDHTFLYSTESAALPDGRAYEMVTPAQKNAALIGDVFLGLEPDVSEGGSQVILSSVQCFAESSSCTVKRGLVGTSYEFSRGPSGWLTTPLGPSATEFEASTVWTVSADTGNTLLSMPTGLQGEDDFYVRHADGSLTHVGPVSEPERGRLGAVGAGGRPHVVSADMSHIVYGELTPVWGFDKSEGLTVYEYTGPAAQPVLVGVSGGRGSTDLISRCGTNPGRVAGNQMPGSMSADGRVVFVTVRGPCEGGTGVNQSVTVPADQLYARIGEADTVNISERSANDCSGECAESPVSDAEFQGASDDGSKAFFTDTQQLTNSASEDDTSGDTASSLGEQCSGTIGPNGCNLYMYDFGLPAGERLVAVSAGDSSGGGPRVQGVMAISNDGSHVYFVAKGVLTGAANGFGQTAVDGGENLYVYERDAAHPEGVTRFITTLLPTDDEGLASASVAGRQWSNGPERANVSPDGRFLVFVSHGVLTPDTGDAGVLQVFRYDAVSGSLVRVSVGDQGFNDSGNSPGYRECNGVSCPDAAVVVRPGAFMAFAGPLRRDPSMSHDGGRVFFMSPVGLTRGALNDVRIGTDDHGGAVLAENVYEWRGGRVFLVSDGRDASIAPTGGCGLVSAVCLVGVDGSGANVFFTSTDQLVPGLDTDTQLDFYDARVCTASDPCVPGPVAARAVCDGEGCHGAPVAQPGALVTPSASFNGQGNVVSEPPPLVKKCRRHFVRRHGRCVRARRRHRRGVRHARGARHGTGRGAGR